MTRFVLDASVSLSWFLDQPVAPYAVQVRRALLGGARAAVPALWHLEMANGFAVAERRGILSAADADASLVQIRQLLSGVIEGEADFVPLQDAFQAARSSGLSAYDAVYLQMARRHALPLATLDSQLRAAAARAGVAMFR